MANNSITDQMVPSAQLLHLKFDLLTGDDIEKFSHVNINDASDLISSKLGVPNACSQCTTCGSTNIGDCEGHFGVIKLPTTIYHPYLIYEVVHILNQICPACKSIKMETKKDMRIKKTISSIRRLLLKMKFEKITMPQTRSLLSCVANAHIKHLKFSGSEKVHSPKQTENIYEMLLRQKHDSSNQAPGADKWKGQSGVDNISVMSSSLSRILHKYPVNHQLNEADKSLLMEALMYHPKKDAKIGVGIKEIKIGHSPFHPNSRCFILIMNDGTTEDFSYRKCVIEAANRISPQFGLMVEKELDPRR